MEFVLFLFIFPSFFISRSLYIIMESIRLYIQVEIIRAMITRIKFESFNYIHLLYFY